MTDSLPAEKLDKAFNDYCLNRDDVPKLKALFVAMLKEVISRNEEQLSLQKNLLASLEETKE